MLLVSLMPVSMDSLNHNDWPVDILSTISGRQHFLCFCPLPHGQGSFTFAPPFEFLQPSNLKRIIDEGILCSVAVMVAAEMNAGELGPAIEDAFLRGRIDRKIMDREDIIFDSEETQPSEYLPPFEFLQPSNLKRIVDEYVDDVLDNDTTDDPELVMKQYYGDAKVNDFFNTSSD